MKKHAFLFLILYSTNLQASNCGYAPLLSIAALVGNLVSIKNDCGRFPNSLEELRGTDEFSVCALQHVSVPINDSWGNAYIYEFEEGMIVPLVKSLGADGKVGTKDNLSNYLDDGSLRESYFVGCGYNPMYIIIPGGMLVCILLGGLMLYVRGKKNA